jgi:hypothetical protein
MAKRRTNKHRAAVKDFEAAWLEGDHKAGLCIPSTTTLYMKNFGTGRAITKTFSGNLECSTRSRTSEQQSGPTVTRLGRYIAVAGIR